MYKEPPLTQYIKLQRLRWDGHVARMGEERIPQKLMYNRIHGKRLRKRWLAQGIRDTKKHTILQSRKNSGTREFGVAFIIDNKIKQHIKDFTPINERMCKIRIKTHFFNLTIINVHCPTEDQDEILKTEFYQKLEQIYDSAPRNDIKMIIGDMNAKIGKEEEYIGTTGKHSLHDESNENGNLLIDFATSKNMVISSTYFPRRDIHKITWISPDGETGIQIDHVLIDKRAATSILNVRSRRGACCNSDHMLVQTTFRCKINQNKSSKTERKERLNIDKLKDQDIRDKLEKEISEKLQEKENPTLESHWENIKNTTKTAAKEILGINKGNETDQWFDEECKRAIGERNKAHRLYMIRRTPVSYTHL